eukprot:3580262-Pleurochrysis_carterae.AAC.1
MSNRVPERRSENVKAAGSRAPKLSILGCRKANQSACRAASRAAIQEPSRKQHAHQLHFNMPPGCSSGQFVKIRISWQKRYRSVPTFRRFVARQMLWPASAKRSRQQWRERRNQ